MSAPLEAMAVESDRPDAPRDTASRRRASVLVLALAALVAPALLALLLQALPSGVVPLAAADGGAFVLSEARRVDAPSLQPPDPDEGLKTRLPFVEPRREGRPGQPMWLVARFELERAADTTWALSFAHRTAALVYLDGRLLANSVPLVEADLPPHNLQIGERLLEVSVPADWLAQGPHVLAVRLGAPGPGGSTLSAVSVGPMAAVEAADRPRRLWFALRVVTALAALMIGTLLLFTWLVERRERLYLWSALQLLMLALLLSPYILSEPPLPSPWWRMLLDAADIVAKGLAPVIVAAWAAVDTRWVPRLAFGYILIALPVDLVAAYHLMPWTDFDQAWPWWALASRLAVLVLAVVVAVTAHVRQPGLHRFGTAALTAFALWVWAYVSWAALVAPGRLAVVDLNVVAYAGWTLWVAVLLHRHLVADRQRERQLRDELADRLAARSEELRRQYAELQLSERARATAAERERLLAEMHDGVGAQLTSAKMLASGGQLSTAEFIDLLDGCLREMRLTVDALSVTDGDLGLLLAALRSRLEPALRAGGLALDWRVDATPRVPSLQGAGGREFTRIVQEALSNVIHHAAASRVEIGTRLTAGGTRVEVWIADDGLGMPAAVRGGRGLRNMRQRAQRVDARIDWLSPPAPARGTIVTIAFALEAG